MKQIEATDVIKTLNWIAQAEETNKNVLEPTLNKNGIYECCVELPLIKKTVIGVGDLKIEAIDNLAKESSKLIDEYLKKNPSYDFKTPFKNLRYVLMEDDNGYLTIHLKKKENGYLDENS